MDPLPVVPPPAPLTVHPPGGGGGAPRVDASGELDAHAVVDALRVRRTLEPRPPTITVDASAVTSIDAAGLSCLVLLADAGCHVRVVNPSPALLDLVDGLAATGTSVLLALLEHRGSHVLLCAPSGR